MESVDEADIRARFRARLIRRRMEAGESQGSLAAKAGLSRTAVVRIENGQRDPSLSSVIGLAAALDTGVDDLVPATLDADDLDAAARVELAKYSGPRKRVNPLFPATITRTLRLGRNCMFPFEPCSCTASIFDLRDASVDG